MKQLQVILLFFLIPVVGFSQENMLVKEQKLFLGICGGLNSSKFSNDTIHFSYDTRLTAGLYGKYKLLKNIYLKSSILYSKKASVSVSPYLKFENTYLDYNLIPQYKLFDGFFLQTGVSYSNLLLSEIVINNGNNWNGVERIANKDFSSEIAIITGTEFRIQKNASLEFNYFIPTTKNGTKSFQLTLNILLNSKLPKQESARQIKRRKSRERIKELKNGTLLVRLCTSENKINSLINHGGTEKANKVKQEQDVENKKIISAFRNNFDFCKVVFFYSNYSDSIRNRKFVALFLNDSLVIDHSIAIDTNQSVFIADFGTIEQDTSKYFSHYSYEPDGNWSIKRVENYYGGPNFGFDALLIRDDHFIQLSAPFPYYTRAIFKSMKKHPEQALFMAPILAFQNWSYNQTVKEMNKKLHRYYARSK